MKPVALDLFCGAGGASRGYADAGYRVIGIDSEPQPHYPYEFHRMDWRDGLRQFGSRAQLIHASPPCQGYSAMNNVHARTYPLLIAPVRAALAGFGARTVIENVEGAKGWMEHPLTLCGAMFGIGVIRHRLFECNWSVKAPGHTAHIGTFYSPAGHGDPNWRHRRANPHLYGPGYTARCRTAMGTTWMTRDEMAQAIPPAYTQWLASQN